MDGKGGKAVLAIDFSKRGPPSLGTRRKGEKLAVLK